MCTPIYIKVEAADKLLLDAKEAGSEVSSTGTELVWRM